MPIMSNIVLDDSASAPQTFKPIRLVNNLATWRDTAAGALVLQPEITSDVRPASASNAGHKVTLKLVLPFTLTKGEDECCIPAGQTPTCQFKIETLVNGRADATTVANLVAFLQDVVQNSDYIDAVKGESWR